MLHVEKIQKKTFGQKRKHCKYSFDKIKCSLRKRIKQR